ncbi:hypothetical protein [Carnobacterium pleistocenium]|uniref:hypothetical protein n=1 Tax=Carnobacterium pleistocenium TaxID=181073 RepID=UPI00054DD0F9|nr:hypothetical protein [Carnobacterium pleistocenium]
MTNEEILALGEKEFKNYIGTERNKAINQNLKLKLNGLKNQKNYLGKSVATLIQESNDALDDANTEIAITKGNEIKALENEISILDKVMERLLANNETLVVIDRERFDELSRLVRIYYAEKINTTRNEFDEKLHDVLPIKNEGDRLLKEQKSLFTGFDNALGLRNVYKDSVLSIDERNALSILLAK